MKMCWLMSFGIFSVAVLPVSAEPEKITHGFLATGGQTYIQDSAGKVVWEYPHSSRDGWVLANGNVLLALSKSKTFPGGGVVEVEAGHGRW